MGNWYLQNGNCSDIVMSTRIRLARNLQEYPFMVKAQRKDLIAILNKIEEVTPSIGYGLKFLRLSNMDDVTKLSLIEKHIISADLAMNKSDLTAILLNEEENICIMLNEEDHLRIQVLAAGLELESTLNLAIEIDRKIEELVNYAYSEKYGFLTACPTNVGTGMRASVMVHLPALSITGNIRKVLGAVNGFNMNVRGLYGEGSNTQGNVYQISNKQSLGISEQEIIKNMKILIEKVIQQERTARRYLTQESIELEDRVYRSYGILTNAKRITSEECKKLLSDVKLGTDMGIIQELDDLKVNKLIIYTKPANLQKYVGNHLKDYERDIKRADVIKQIIKS